MRPTDDEATATHTTGPSLAFDDLDEETRVLDNTRGGEELTDRGPPRAAEGLTDRGPSPRAAEELTDRGPSPVTEERPPDTDLGATERATSGDVETIAAIRVAVQRGKGGALTVSCLGRGGKTPPGAVSALLLTGSDEEATTLLAMMLEDPPT